MTFDGEAFSGTDGIKTVGCKIPPAPAVTVDEYSSVYRAGMTFTGVAGASFTSDTKDSLGPFYNKAVHFRGTIAGGSTLVYRYRLEYKHNVDVKSVVVEDAAWDGGGIGLDTIRLLDANRREVASIDASVPVSGNYFRTITVPVIGAVGKVFFPDEINGDTEWRYRSNIVVDSIPRSNSKPVKHEEKHK